jgi:hypothetical protein
MLKYGEVNPLSVFGLRQIEYCPPHFIQVTFDLRTNIKNISDWIHENLSGRFYVGDVFLPNPESPGSGLTMQKVAAFERHEEASYFGLFLPNINIHNSYDW